jgi:hypothetical protein
MNDQQPKPISSPKEVDSHAAAARARRDNIDFATARGRIFREMLSDGRAQSSSLLRSLRNALKIESSAQKQLDQATEERQQLEAVQNEWDRAVDELDAMNVLLSNAAAEVDAVRQSALQIPLMISGKLGRFDSVNPAGQLAITAAQAIAALPLMESAERELIDAFHAKVGELRSFGSKHGVPESALAALPSRATT